MPKERNKADDYREKAYQGDTKAMNRSLWSLATSGTQEPRCLLRVANAYYLGNGVEMDHHKQGTWFEMVLSV